MLQGWTPLCEFLEVPQPVTPFPYENKLGQAGNIIDKYRKFSVFKRAEEEVRKVRQIAFLFILMVISGGLFHIFGAFPLQ